MQSKLPPLLLLLLLLAGCAKTETRSPMWSGVSARMEALDWSWENAYLSDWEESPYLKGDLLRHLGLPRNSKIRPRDLEEITAWFVNVDEPLDNLRYCVNLEELYIEYYIAAAPPLHTDYTFIASLPKLRELKIHNTKHLELSFLENHTALKVLDLGSFNQVADLTPLAGCTGLRKLMLDDNLVADLSPLAALTGLETLSLGHNQIADISPLCELTGLERLSLRSNQVTDLSPLAGLDGLRTLNLMDNEALSDLSPLAGLTRLSTLSISYTAVEDLSPLAGCAGLSSISAVRCQIRDITPLIGLELLECADLERNQISRGLEGTSFARIQGFQLEHNPLDYAPLAEDILLPEHLVSSSASGRFHLYAFGQDPYGYQGKYYAHDAQTGGIILADRGTFHGELIYSRSGGPFLDYGIEEHYQDPATGERLPLELEENGLSSYPYWGKQFHHGLGQWVSLTMSDTTSGAYRVNYHSQMGEYLHSVDTPYIHLSYEQLYDNELLAHQSSGVQQCYLWGDWLLFYDFAGLGERWPGQRIAAYNVVTGGVDYAGATFYATEADYLALVYFQRDEEDNPILVCRLIQGDEERFVLGTPYGLGPLEDSQYYIQFHPYDMTLAFQRADTFAGVYLDFAPYLGIPGEEEAGSDA